MEFYSYTIFLCVKCKPYITMKCRKNDGFLALTLCVYFTDLQQGAKLFMIFKPKYKIHFSNLKTNNTLFYCFTLSCSVLASIKLNRFSFME